MNRYKPPINPWDPPELSDHEVMALKALRDGVASAGQQKMALSAIVVKFASAGDMSFRPGGEDGRRATDFSEGKKYVAQRIQEALTRPMKPTGGQNAGTSNPTSAGKPTPEPAAARTRRNPKPTATGKPTKG